MSAAATEQDAARARTRTTSVSRTRAARSSETSLPDPICLRRCPKIAIPEPSQRLLPRPDHVERDAVVQFAALHHVADGRAVLDVLERVAIEDNKVCELADLETPEILLHPESIGDNNRRRSEHLVIGHPAQLEQ